MDLFTLNLTNFSGGRNTSVSEVLVRPNQSPLELNIKSRPVGALARRDGSRRYFPDNFGNYPAIPTGLHKLYRTRDVNHVYYVYVPPNLWAVYPGGARAIVKNDFTEGTFCEFATMKDQAYGTNYADLPFRAYDTFVKEAELAPLIVPNQWNDGVNFDGLSSVNGARSITDASSKHSMGFSAYRFRGYYGKDLGESAFGRVTQVGTRAGVPTTQVWKTSWFGFWGYNTGDPLAQNRIELNIGASIIVPAGVEKIRIFRTQVLSFLTSVGGTIDPPLPSRDQILAAPYYFLDEVAAPYGIYVDKKSDDDLGQLADPDPGYHQYARYIAKHHNRLFYANVNERWLDRATNAELETDGFTTTYGNNDTAHPSMAGTIFWYTVGPVAPSRLYFSYFYEPSRIESFIDIFPEDGDVITAIKPLGPLLIVFKRNHVYALAGVDFADFDPRLLDDTVGCVAPLSIAQYRETLLFYSGTSIYQTDGSSVREIGQNIREDLKRITTAMKPYCSAGVHEDDYLLAVGEP